MELTLTPSDPFRERVKELPAGACVTLEPGIYQGGLWIERSITVRAAGLGVVLVRDEGSVVEIANDADAEVVLDGLMLRGSRARVAALAIHRARKVTVRNCNFQHGNGEIGAVMVRAAEAELADCVFLNNTGTTAQALLAYHGGRARLTDCLIAASSGDHAAIVAQGAAMIVLDHCTVVTRGAPAMRAIGTGVDAPIMQAIASILGDPPIDVVLGGPPLPNVTVLGCALSRPLGQYAEDLGGSVVGELARTPAFHSVPGTITAGRGVRWPADRA